MSKAIALPFSFNGDGGVNSTQDLKKIIQDRVVLVVMTQIGERINRPKYGTAVKNSLFESTDKASNIIKDEVANGFNLWLNYLTLLSVNPVVDPLDGHISINITYRYGSSSNPETVVVKTDILSQSGDVIAEVPNVK